MQHPLFGPVKWDEADDVWKGVIRLPEFADFRIEGIDNSPRARRSEQQKMLDARPERLSLKPSDDVSPDMHRRVGKHIQALIALGYEEVGGAVDTWIDEPGNETPLMVLGMINARDNAWMIVYQEFSLPRFVFHRRFTDGSRLTLTNSWDELSLSLSVEDRSSKGLPDRADAVGPGGVVRLVIHGYDVATTQRLHEELLTRSGNKRPAPIRREEFLSFCEEVYAQDHAEAQARAKQSFGGEIEAETRMQKMTDAKLIAAYLEDDGDESDSLLSVMRRRGLFPLEIETGDDPEKTLDEPAVKEVFERFIQDRRNLVRDVLAKGADVLRMQTDEELDSPDELKRRMELTSVTIDLRGRRKRRLALHFEPEFDPEHGLHLEIRGDAIKVVDD